MACSCGKPSVKKTDAKQVTRKVTPSRQPQIRKVIKRPAK